MALILNIDTATSNCSVCIAENGKPLAIREDRQAFTHAEVLTPFISELLKECNLSMSSLNAIAISEGPGSYTGLRIGTSVAKGICFATGIPLIAVGTLPALAHQMQKKYENFPHYITIMDSRKDELYIAAYSNKLEELIAPMPINVKSIDQINIPINEAVVSGTGMQKLQSTVIDQIAIVDKHLYFSSVNMVYISFMHFKNKAFKNLIYFEPLYLKSVFVL